MRVTQCATDEYTIFLFKKQNVNNTDAIAITWDGQTDLAPASSTVYLQIFNRVSGAWETKDQMPFTYDFAADYDESSEFYDGVQAANVDFTLTATISADVGNYYDGSNWVSWRVYQQAIT